MNLSNKYDIIHSSVIQANEIVDARGVDKCVAIINLIQNLNELARMLKEEDQQHEATIKSLTDQLDKLEEATKHADADTD